MKRWLSSKASKELSLWRMQEKTGQGRSNWDGKKIGHLLGLQTGLTPTGDKREDSANGAMSIENLLHSSC